MRDKEEGEKQVGVINKYWKMKQKNFFLKKH